MELFSKLKNTNMVTLAITICSIVALITVKEYIDPFYRKQIKKIKLFRNVQIPIPVELIVVSERSRSYHEDNNLITIDHSWYISFVFF